MYHPVISGGGLPHGVSVPTLTALSASSGSGDKLSLAKNDQRNLLKFIVQNGFGADIIFGVGTTGEWNRVSNIVRQDIMTAHAEFMAEWNQGRSGAGREPVHGDGHARVPCWVGITAPTAEETLDNLAHSLTLPVDAVVIAPLSLSDVNDIERFFYRDISDLMHDFGRVMPIVLYDNADIAADTQVHHLRTRQVKQLARLDFVVGIKVTASRRRIGHYTKASAHFNEAHEFAIYAGNAHAIFDIFRPPRGLAEVVKDRWNRFLMHGSIPVGVVPSYANLYPREWQFVWQACLAGDNERLLSLAEAFREFSSLCAFDGKKKTVACMKYGLTLRGVIESSLVAPGTPELTSEDEAEFDIRYGRFSDKLAVICGERWTSQWPLAD